MAYKATNEQFINKQGRHVIPHPWEQWMDGSRWVAEAGKDFDKVVSFRSLLWSKGTPRGLSVRTQVLQNGNVLFQFFKKDTPTRGDEGNTDAV